MRVTKRYVLFSFSHPSLLPIHFPFPFHIIPSSSLPSYHPFSPIPLLFPLLSPSPLIPSLLHTLPLFNTIWRIFEKGRNQTALTSYMYCQKRKTNSHVPKVKVLQIKKLRRLMYHTTKNRHLTANGLLLQAITVVTMATAVRMSNTILATA